jgi:hypothetical protein
MAFISRRRVLRRDGSLCRCKAVAICSAITGRGRRDEWRRRSISRAADSGPRGEPRAQPAPPAAPCGQGLDQMRRMKTCVAPDRKTAWGARLSEIFCADTPKSFGGPLGRGEWRCSQAFQTNGVVTGARHGVAIRSGLVAAASGRSL